jgi:hypothetical protein
VSIFRIFFSGENSAENFPPKNVVKKWNFPGKNFEKLFFKEILRNFPPKVIFRGKKCTKNRHQVVDVHVVVEVVAVESAGHGGARAAGGVGVANDPHYFVEQADVGAPDDGHRLKKRDLSCMLLLRLDLHCHCEFEDNK